MAGVSGVLEWGQCADRLRDEDRAIVKQVMELVILMDRFRKLLAQSGGGPAEIYALQAGRDPASTHNYSMALQEPFRHLFVDS